MERSNNNSGIESIFSRLRHKFLIRRLKLKTAPLLALLIVVLFGIFVYLKRDDVFRLVAKTGILGFLRDKGVIRPTISGYFGALEDGNLLYDYNNDGSISGDDYSPMLEDLGYDIRVSEITVISGDDESAVAENLNLPSVKGISPDAFTGSATTSYPIDLPDGPGGLTPSLSLSYSSGSVDDLYTGTETKWRIDPTHPYQKQAGVVGLGWSLNNGGGVYRDTQGTLNDPSDDTFSLSFEGGSANLTFESGVTPELYSVWRTSPNLKAKVERWGICKVSTTTLCRYKWLVTTGDGTKYTFGVSGTLDLWSAENDPDKALDIAGDAWFPLYNSSDYTLYSPWLIYGSTQIGWHALVYEWPLRQVTDVHGLNIKYSYHFELGDYKEKKYVKAVYPYKITYGENEIEFVRQRRYDYMTHQGDNSVVSQPFSSQYRINKILIKTSRTIIRSYLLDYKYGYDATKHPDTNGNGVLDESEVIGGQVIHSLLEKITPWSGDPGYKI